MKEIIINEIHIIITVITLIIYIFLCSITDYSDPVKLSQTKKNISFARIIFGFLTALFLLSLEIRYMTIVFKDKIFFRTSQLIICLILIGLFLYSNENKFILGDTYDKIFKILSPIIVALSIMSSNSLNNLFNHYKDIPPLVLK